MCRYRLIFPQQAGDFDQIKIYLLSAKNVELTVVETETYKNSEFKEKVLPLGDTYTADYPNEVFLLVLSDESGSNGEFTISY